MLVIVSKMAQKDSGFLLCKISDIFCEKNRSYTALILRFYKVITKFATDNHFSRNYTQRVKSREIIK